MQTTFSPLRYLNPPPPELLSGVHAKRKNPMRTFPRTVVSDFLTDGKSRKNKQKKQKKTSVKHTHPRHLTATDA